MAVASRAAFFLIASAGIALGSGTRSIGTDSAPGALELQPPARVFQVAHPGAGLYLSGERITTVYGRAFSAGGSPVESAEKFLNAHGAMLGVHAADLVPGSLATDGLHERELMPDLETGAMKFTLVSYLQNKDGIPVFRGNVRLLTRNEPGFPLVLVRNGLRNVEGFVVDDAVATAPNIAAAFDEAALRFGPDSQFSVPEVVIWAGVDEADTTTPPALALVFEVEFGDIAHDGYGKWQVVADAATGRTLWSQNLVTHVDVNGTVQGMATTGKKADTCASEVATPMPYARVSIGGTVAYTDVNGAFTIPNAGSANVSVSSGYRGRWFRTYDASTGLDIPALSQSVSPPGPANFTHNSANTNATQRSGVNAYVQANTVRDYVLAHSPNYPTIKTQAEFRVNVNVSGTCNAFYNGSSINFYPAGGGCPSTAFADVVHHEYGHHLVQVAGSLQASYGEGMGDVMGVLITDEPVLGYGFSGNCNAGIRNANNTKQYPQTGEIHDAGQLISGCVWDVRNRLRTSNPSTYRAIIAALAINSMPLHNGGDINPQITIDYLTLDDDNGDIGDGTPHYADINGGFSVHNMAGPPLVPLAFSFPDGQPTTIDPDGTTTMRVVVSANANQPQPNTGKLYFDPENDGTFISASMTQTSPNNYTATFPSGPCGGSVRYYVSARTTSNVEAFSPGTAPSEYTLADVAAVSVTALSDTFQTNLGWATSADASTTNGLWERGVPSGGNPGAPTTDYDGSGSCFLTGNATGYSDVDGGHVYLDSPTFNASGAGEATLSFARWFTNAASGQIRSDLMLIRVSNNDGASWTTVQTIGPSIDAAGGWKTSVIRLKQFIPLTSTMKVRFDVSDLFDEHLVEAAIDAVKITVSRCSCPSDVNGDGFIDALDYDVFIGDWLVSNTAADYNGDGFVDAIDYDEFMTGWLAGSC